MGDASRNQNADVTRPTVSLGTCCLLFFSLLDHKEVVADEQNEMMQLRKERQSQSLIMLKLVYLFSVLSVGCAFLQVNGGLRHETTLKASSICPEIPLSPRPGNEIAVFALG